MERRPRCNSWSPICSFPFQYFFSAGRHAPVIHTEKPPTKPKMGLRSAYSSLGNDDYYDLNTIGPIVDHAGEKRLRRTGPIEWIMVKEFSFGEDHLASSSVSYLKIERGSRCLSMGGDISMYQTALAMLQL